MLRNFNKFLKKHLIYSKTDLNGIITEVSEEFCKISGYTKSELIGQPHNIVRSDSSSPLMFIQLWNAIENDRHWEGVVENKHKSGKSYFVYTYIYPVLDSNGNKIGYESFRKNLLETMLYDSLFHSEENHNKETTTTISILTNGKNLKSINNEALNLFEVNNFKEFTDKYQRISELFTIPDYITESTFDINSFLLEIDENEVFWIDNIDKKPFCCMKINEKEYFFTIKKDYSFGSISQITFNNITSYFEKNLKMNNELTNSTKLLKKQEKMVVMGDMLHNIAHQWRQPLGVISSLVSSIQFDIDNDMLETEELSENVGLILEQSNYLTKTIDTFRNYLKNNDDIAEINLKNTLDTTISLISHVYNVNNIKIDFHCDIEHNYIVYGIEDQLIQVLINLFNNSKDAFLEKDDKGDRAVRIDMFVLENNDICIEFADNAGGIPLYIIDNIFEPYVSTKGKNGTGIGLNMSYDIITKSFFGNISVENNKINGATFRITLPL